MYISISYIMKTLGKKSYSLSGKKDIGNQTLIAL